MAKALTLQTIFSAVDKMSGPVKTITGKVEKMNATAAKFARVGAAVAKGAAIVGAAAIAAGVVIGRAAMSFAEKGDEIAKTARMLGLSAEALQEMRYAAGIQGVETEALTQGFKLLNNQLGQLKIGTGSLATTLEKTNPKLAAQLKTVNDTDEAFMLLMGAIKAETDIAKRAALAQAAFGKSGQELIKFADAGAEGIAALRTEAHKYGLVIDEEAAKNSEAFNDSMSRLKQSAMSLANQGLARVIEKFQPLLQRAADWIAANKEMIGERLDKAFELISKIAGSVGRVFQTLAPALEPLFNLIMAILPAVELLAKVVEAVLGPIVKVIGVIAQGLADIFDGTYQGQGTTAAASASGRTRESTAQGGSRGRAGTQGVPLAPAVAYSSTERSILDVNFNNTPSGTSMRQSGSAPGITVNQGPTMSRRR